VTTMNNQDGSSSQVTNTDLVLSYSGDTITMTKSCYERLVKKLESESTDLAQARREVEVAHADAVVMRATLGCLKSFILLRETVHFGILRTDNHRDWLTRRDALLATLRGDL